MASHFFFQLVVADVFVHSSVEMGMFIKRIAGCPPNSDYWEYSFALWQGIINCLPNGSYQLTAYSQSVTSSIHQAPSGWHLYDRSLCEVEETQPTFMGFGTHFHHSGIL